MIFSKKPFFNLACCRFCNLSNKFCFPTNLGFLTSVNLGFCNGKKFAGLPFSVSAYQQPAKKSITQLDTICRTYGVSAFLCHLAKQEPKVEPKSSLKANFYQSIVLLHKIKKKQKLKRWDIPRSNRPGSKNTLAFRKLKSDSLIFKKQYNLKPFSTVSGFKKYMFNSVKISQNQLQPGYNRSKHCHSHYNQIFKESSRLSNIYGHLSKAQVLNLSAFTLNLSILNKPNTEKCNQRPIPKLAFFLESQHSVILWRNQQQSSIFSAKQQLRKGVLLNGNLQKKASIPTFPGDVFSPL